MNIPSLDIEDLIEIRLKQPDDFLKVKETLTRIGVPSKHKPTLYQSCHILHKRQRYFIVHFLELFMLDGKPSNFTETDKARRNTIANMLHEWGLVELVDVKRSETPVVPGSVIKVLSHKEKADWNLEAKYNIGIKKKITKEAA